MTLFWQHLPIVRLVSQSMESMLIPMQDILPCQERMRSRVSREPLVTIDTRIPSELVYSINSSRCSYKVGSPPAKLILPSVILLCVKYKAILSWIFLSDKFAEAVGAMIIATVGNVVIYHVKVFHNNPPKNDLGGSYRSVLIRIFCCFCSYRESFRRISLKRT